MNSYKRVAILLATYNGSKYLREQIDSILCQEKIGLDIFVRDDHSTDETSSILEEYSSEYNNFKVLKAIEGQLGPGRNFFSILIEIDLSQYDFVSYCDQDDKWLSNKLSEAVYKIEAETVNCYGSNLYLWNGGSITGILNKATPQTEYDFLFESASAGCTLVIDRKSAIYLKDEILKYFTQLPFEISHDWYTYAITRIGDFKWYLDDRSFIYYRQHSSNQYGANEGIRGVKKMLQLFTSGWYKENILRITELFFSEDNIQKTSFILKLKHLHNLSFLSRNSLAIQVAKYRRRKRHKLILYFLIVFKVLK